MSWKVAQTQVAVNTSTGNQTITTTDLEGVTPVAALFFMTNATANGTPVSDGVLSTGAATGSGEQWSLGSFDEDGVGTTNTSRESLSDACVTLIDSTGASLDCEASFVSFTTNGCTINWVSAPASAYLLTVVFFYGTNMQAEAGLFTSSGVLGTPTTITTGFQTDIAFFSNQLQLFSSVPGVSTFRYNTFGCGVNDGVPTQYCIEQRSVNGQADSKIFSKVESYAWSSVGRSNEIGNFTSTSFDMTNRNIAYSESIGYLAIGFGEDADFDLTNIQPPTSTGSDSVTGIGFKPQALIGAMTNAAVVGTEESDDDAGAFGLFVSDKDESYSISINGDDNVGTTDIESVVDDQIVNQPYNPSTSGHAATLTRYDTDGWTWNFSSTLAQACQWWVLSIGESFRIPRHPAIIYQNPAIA